MSLDEDVLKQLLKELYNETDELRTNRVKSSRLVNKVCSMLPENSSEGAHKNDALGSLQNMLSDSDEDDVLVSLEKFLSVGIRWINQLQSQPAAPDYSAHNSSASLFNNSTEVNVNSFSVWDSLNMSSPGRTFNGSGFLGGDSFCFSGSSDARRELEHAHAKIADLEKRLVNTEEVVDQLESEKKEVQAKNSELQKKVSTMDRRLSGNFHHLQKVEEINAQNEDVKRQLSEENSVLKKSLDNAKEAIRNMTVNMKEASELEDEGSNSDSGTDEKVVSSEGAQPHSKSRLLLSGKKNLELTQELENVRNKTQGDLKTPIKRASNATPTPMNVQTPTSGGRRVEFDNTDDVFINGSGDISCDGPAMKEILFKSAMAEHSFGESPFANNRWQHSSHNQQPPSAQSTPFARLTKKGRIESLGAEIRALGDDRSPLCEKSFQSSKQSETPVTTAVRLKAATSDRCTQTDPAEPTTTGLVTAGDKCGPVTTSDQQCGPMTTSDRNDEEEELDFGSAVFVICDDVTWSRFFDRCLMVLVTVLTVFTFAGGIEYEGRKIYPLTWRWLAQPLGLPEPVVALAFNRSPNAPY